MWDKIHIDEWSPDACWGWVGALAGKGLRPYAYNPRSKRCDYVSRIMIQNDLTKEKPYALHKCNNGNCVRPSHLYAGTQKDNVADMVRAGNLVNTLTNKLKAQTQCKRGHVYNQENTYQKKSGGRQCRVCKREAK